MPKELIISANVHEKKVAMLEDGVGHRVLRRAHETRIKALSATFTKAAS